MLKTLLNPFNSSKRILLLIAIAFIFFALLITLNCGKRKPPLPPIEKISQRVVISGIQRGNKVIISWTMPARNASDTNILNISRADVYRLAEPQNTSLTLSEEEFAASSTLIATVPVSESDFGLKSLTYTDELEFSGQSARLRYAIRFVNAQGQKAAFSNFLIIEPAPKIADSPKLLTADVSEQSINLSWDSPKANVDGTIPVNLLGYNVYRTPKTNEISKLLNSAPVTKTEFSDKLFEFGNEYSYFVRAVSLGTNGEPVESLDSNIVKILPKDIFAPSPPTAITIAAAPNNLSIFFAVNPEKDIAGYRIYRSTEPNLPKAEWQLLTSEILKTNTFQDKSVESGKTYYYYITSIDTAGNISQPSEVVSEKVP
jgi:fibronectin type 3 domain-containing protein